jgi:peptide/nickel transport system substrate-binding protein
LRQILSRSLNRQQIMERADNGQGTVTSQPLLPGQIGYTNRYALPPLDQSAVRGKLDEAGWVQKKAGAVRTKNGAQLQFKLTTLKGGELEQAAREIKRQWAGLGIGLTIITANSDELQQTYMRPRNFQMMLYGVNLGSDPDVYSYWHSSQAQDPGVNLSGYNSTDTDRALEAGRIKNDPDVRTAKYDAFLKAWNADAPAAVLYQSGYVYGTRDTTAGIMAHRLVVPADRYYDVERWTVRRRLVPRH